MRTNHIKKIIKMISRPMRIFGDSGQKTTRKGKRLMGRGLASLCFAFLLLMGMGTLALFTGCSEKKETPGKAKLADHDHGTEAEHDHGTEADHDHATEAKHDHGTEADHDHATEAKHDHGTEADHDHATEAKHDHGTEAKHDHGTEADHDHEKEVKLAQGAEADHGHEHENTTSPEIVKPEADHDHKEDKTKQGSSLIAPSAPKAAQRFLDMDEKTAKKWNIQTAQPEYRDFVEKITLTGVIKENSATTFMVSAQVPGVVTRLLRDIGDKTMKGDTLCELNSPELLDIKTRYMKAIQDYRQKKESFSRAKSLFNIKALEQKEFISRESDYKTAQAELFSLEASLELAGIPRPSLEGIKKAVQEDREEQIREFLTPRYRIPAPATGRVVMRDVNLGERVENSRLLFEISDNRNMWAILDVLEKDQPLASKGQAIAIVSDIYPETPFHATIQAINEKLDPQLRTVKIRALVENPKGLLKAEMYVRGLLESKQTRKLLSTPSTALVKIGGALGVFIAANKGFAFQPVRVEATDSNGFTFISGIGKTDQIVFQGAFYLKAEMEIQTGGTDPHAGHSH